MLRTWREYDRFGGDQAISCRWYITWFSDRGEWLGHRRIPSRVIPPIAHAEVEIATSRLQWPASL